MSDLAEPLTLENCHREPIHILGKVQSFGFLLALDASNIVRHASTSIEKHLQWKADGIIGKFLPEVIGPSASSQIMQRCASLGPNVVERMFGLTVAGRREKFSCAVFRSSELTILELEPVDDDPSLEAASTVRSMMARLQSAAYPDALFQEAARQARSLTGFDRVMVYKFMADRSGAVVAESRVSFVDSFLGLRYPASDIPQQARELYTRNWLRIIADVDAEPSVILPPFLPDGRPIDLSLSVLRSVSPIHIEYLKNMGVKASLSISIVVGGELWGLIACHHYQPRHISFERRTAAEVFANMLSLLVSTREREREIRYQSASREKFAHILARMSNPTEIEDPLPGLIDSLSGAIDSDGVAVVSPRGAFLNGATPDETAVREIGEFLKNAGVHTTLVTNKLSDLMPSASRFASQAAGMIALPVSRSPRDYILFFRRELVQVVRWAGNPDKPMVAGPYGSRLTPRESFAEWKQTVALQSEAWSPDDLVIAEELRRTIHEIVLHLTDAVNEERRQAMERQQLLIAELNHRVRNILGLVRGIVRQSRSQTASVEAFSNTLLERVSSLARAHDNISENGGAAGSLEELIRTEADAYLHEKKTRIKLTGPSVYLTPNAYSTLSLVLHELITNAAKYGALSDRHGVVEIIWDARPDHDLEIYWQESGGPAVTAPMRRGFGTTLVTRAVPHDLGGNIQQEFHMTGVKVRMTIPKRHITDTHLKETVVAMKDITPANLQGRLKPLNELLSRVLIVEDTMILALDLEDQFKEMGAGNVDIAADVCSALRTIAEAKPTFAILDVNLGKETSFPVAVELNKLGVPYVFATGYGENAAFPDNVQAVRVISKPVDPDNLQSLIRGLA